MHDDIKVESPHGPAMLVLLRSV